MQSDFIASSSPKWGATTTIVQIKPAERALFLENYLTFFLIRLLPFTVLIKNLDKIVMLNLQTSDKHSRNPVTVVAGVIMSNLIKKVAVEQDHRAFQELYLKFGPRVKSYLMKQGADNATAEELAQETMLTVWRKAALFEKSRGSAASWVFTIARNLRIDRFRKEKAWQELSDEHLEHRSDETPVDEQISQNQLINTIRSVLAELPNEQRQIIELSYLRSLSQSEIAARLKLPLGTVKSRMRLAYQKIRLSAEELI